MPLYLGEAVLLPSYYLDPGPSLGAGRSAKEFRYPFGGVLLDDPGRKNTLTAQHVRIDSDFGLE